MRVSRVRSRARGTAGLSAANRLEHAREAAPPAAPLEAQPHRPCTAPTAAGTARARRAERVAAQGRGRRIGERGVRGTPPRDTGAPGRRRPLVVLPRGEARPSHSTGERKVMGSQAARKAAARRSAAPRSGSRREPRALGYTQRPGNPGALPRAIHPPDTAPGQAPRRAPLPAAAGTAPPKWRSSVLPQRCAERAQCACATPSPSPLRPRVLPALGRRARPCARTLQARGAPARHLQAGRQMPPSYRSRLRMRSLRLVPTRARTRWTLAEPKAVALQLVRMRPGAGGRPCGTRVEPRFI